MSVRFLHTADLHLGSPLRTIGVESKALQETLRDATYRAFTNIVEIAIDEAVDFVVIAGDLYDQESRSVRANQFVVEQFERLGEQEIPCYLVYGNHDPLGSRSELLELPDNVHAFGHEEVEIVEYPSDGPSEARILGQSYWDSAESRSMYEQFTPPDEQVPNIGVLHTGLDPDAGKYAPCSEADLKGMTDIHYWALGHIHQQRIYSGRPTLAYPGIPQSRDVTEPDVGGCFIVDVDLSNEPTLTFVPTSPVVWLERQVSIDDQKDTIENLTDLEELLAAEAETVQTTDPSEFLRGFDVDTRDGAWSHEGIVCRWKLVGRGTVHAMLEEEDEVEAFLSDRLRGRFEGETPFVWTESIRNHTGPPLPDLDELRENDPVIREFFEIVAEVRGDPSSQNALRDDAGNIWYEPEDPEEIREDRLQLTDEKFDELIDHAEALVIDELITRREHVDS